MPYSRGEVLKALKDWDASADKSGGFLPAWRDFVVNADPDLQRALLGDISDMAGMMGRGGGVITALEAFGAVLCLAWNGGKPLPKRLNSR